MFSKIEMFKHVQPVPMLVGKKGKLPALDHVQGCGREAADPACEAR